MISTRDIVAETVEKIALERAAWIDSLIASSVPSWKLSLLKKFNHPLLRKIIGADIEIITENLIADFGNQTIIKLNGKVIGKMKYNLKLP